MSQYIDLKPRFFGQEISVTSSIALTSNRSYNVDTTNAITLTMPVAPNTGDYVVIKDTTGLANTNNITVDRNGKKIEDLSANKILQTNYGAWTFVYDGVDTWWMK